MLKQWVLSKNMSLIDVRIVFLFIAFVHHIITAIVTLNIDMTVDEDPKVRAYHYIRWKLITAWFNLLILAYLPVKLYVDLKKKWGEGGGMVAQIKHATDVVMTSILVPVVIVADLSFWVIFCNIGVEVLTPGRAMEYLPGWAQHSLHSVSGVVVVLDLLLTPRRRPTSLKPRLALLLAFSFTYYFVVLNSYFKGEMLYNIFADISAMQITLIFAFALSMVLIFFSLQWVAIDFLWQSKSEPKKNF